MRYVNPFIPQYNETFSAAFLLSLEDDGLTETTPNQLHFSSATAYHDIYNPSARWDKDRVQYASVGADHSTVCLIPYEESKQRKAILSSLFSRRSVLNLEGLVRRKVRLYFPSFTLCITP